MTGSKLKFSPSKKDFLLICTKFQREKFLNNSPCLILGKDTNTSAAAKNLGVVIKAASFSRTILKGLYGFLSSFAFILKYAQYISEP